MRRTAALIVGGGPAGSAAAIALGLGGVRSELIERTDGDRDVVCGGFLGWDALAALRRLGVDPETLGARPIHCLRLVAGRRSIEVKLPRRAAGLSRRRLDSALLAAAERAGTAVTRGRAARAADPHGRIVRLDDGEEIGADALFLATGKHELRGAARSLEGRHEAPAAGLRAELPASAARDEALTGVIELHLFDRGYAGLLLQEDGTANVCLSIAADRLSAAGGVEPLLAELLSEAPALAQRMGERLPEAWDAIAGVPYGWRARQTEPGLFRIGDQAAVIASLAGDGIAIALTSGMAAARRLLEEGAGAAESWQREFAGRAARPLAVAEVVRAMAERKGRREALMRLLRFTPGLARAAARLTRIA